LAIAGLGLRYLRIIFPTFWGNRGQILSVLL
jgi:hypothetical protein